MFGAIPKDLLNIRIYLSNLLGLISSVSFFFSLICHLSLSFYV